MTKKLVITGVAHVGIRVHNLDRSRAFYEGLGFEFVIGPVGPEPVAILKHPCGVEINLVLNAVDAEADNILMDVKHKHAGYTHVALKVEDVDAPRWLISSRAISKYPAAPMTTRPALAGFSYGTLTTTWSSSISPPMHESGPTVAREL